MESGGSVEAALRHERQHRAEAEANVLAMESQYETAGSNMFFSAFSSA